MGNGQKFTVSLWFKYTNYNASVGRNLFVVANGSNYFSISLSTDDRLYVLATGGAINVSPSQVFRDSSTWYHAVVSVDTTLLTNTDRVKIYINGQRVTSLNTSTFPSQQGYQTEVSNTSVHVIGARPSPNYHF